MNCYVCYVTRICGCLEAQLISLLSIVLHWNSASNYIDTTVLAAPGSDILTFVLFLLSSVYIHTHPTTLVSVTLQPH